MTICTLALNAQGDSYLDASGNIAVLYGEDAISQNVVNSLRLWLGEAIFAIDRGVNWKAMLGFENNDQLFRGYMNKACLEAQGVESVQNISYTIDPNTRALSASITVNGNINVVINVNTTG